MNRRLRIAVLNIMPDKVRTEKDILRALSSGGFSFTTDFIALETHRPSPASADYIREHYIPFSKIRENRYDALIITGAPLEMYRYEDVTYFDEFLRIAEWAENGGAKMRMYICWAAFALVYARYGIGKHLLPSKLSGQYPHHLVTPHPIMNGIREGFHAPHSRNIYISTREVNSTPQLHILAESPTAGIHAVYDSAHNDYLVFGHWEYAPDTLSMEYFRDKAKGLEPEIPANYFIHDNTEETYDARWIEPGQIFFRNFLKAASEK